MFYALGGISWGLAALFAYGGAKMSTSAPETAEGIGQVANIQLLDIQIIAFIIAIGFGVMGAIFIAAGGIVARMDKQNDGGTDNVSRKDS